MNERNEPRGQHYVPRFYLNYFSDDRITNGKYVWRYRIGESDPLRSATRRIASIPDYYTIEPQAGERDFSFETEILKPAEDRAAPCLRALQENRFDFNDDDAKADMAVFLSFMLQRTPAVRDVISEAFGHAEGMRAHMMAQDRDRFLSLLERFSQETNTEISDPDRMRELMLAGRIRFEPTNAFHVQLMLDVVDTIYGALMNMRWQCFLAVRGARFITSDRPAAIFNAELQGTGRGAGLGQQHAEVFLPVSPTVGLLLSWIGGSGFMPLTPDLVHEMNKRTISLCYREVYASRQDREIGDLSASMTP